MATPHIRLATIAIFYVLTLGSGALGIRATNAQESRGTPNFILILTDDQGWTMLSEPMHPDVPDSSIGYFHTPAMNRLAREGMRFTSGYSPGPLCTPTRRGIQNGMTPARQRGTEFPSDNWIPAAHLTLPRALQQANSMYACAHFGKWGENMLSTPEECGYVASDGMTGNVTGGAGTDRFDG